MSTQYFPIYLYHLQFLSSMSYSFQCTDLSLPWSNLSLGIFHAVVHGIIFSISLSDSSLLVYRNATSIHVLILYPATLLNSFILTVFLVGSLKVSVYNIMSLQRVTVSLFLSSLDNFHFLINGSWAGRLEATLSEGL